jgi:hypothetical protein
MLGGGVDLLFRCIEELVHERVDFTVEVLV